MGEGREGSRDPGRVERNSQVMSGTEWLELRAPATPERNEHRVGTIGFQGYIMASNALAVAGRVAAKADRAQVHAAGAKRLGP